MWFKSEIHINMSLYPSNMITCDESYSTRVNKTVVGGIMNCTEKAINSCSCREKKTLKSISLQQESNKIITSYPKRDKKSKTLQANVSTEKLAAVSAIEKGKVRRRRRRVKTETGEIWFHEKVWEIGERTKSSLLHHAEMRRYAYLLD